MYINCLRDRVISDILTKKKRPKYNLSIFERRAINSLKNNTLIIISKADKGGATVVMNKFDYIKEAERQLHDPNFYVRLNEDPTQKYIKELKSLIKTFSLSMIKELEHLIKQDPKPGMFYMLQQIHKEGNPGRPIVSGINTITEGISGYIDKVLQPYAMGAPSYVQDTTDFLRKIRAIGTIPAGTILATMDVSSLYTNIPHDDGLEAVSNFLENHPNSHSIRSLIRYILKHNYFIFNNELFLQKTGTAMGTRMAPQFANIFMRHLEQTFLESQTLKPLLYLRYIDDIFIVWTHGQTELNRFHIGINAVHPTIKLTMEYSTTEVNFLDTKVQIVNQELTTTLYRKPTDKYSYLHSKSFHPTHIKNSIVYSQALRYNRICSDTPDRDANLDILKKAFSDLQYPIKMVNEQITRSKLWDRESLLEMNNKPEHDRVPLIITYGPHSHQLKKIIKDLQPILTSDDKLKSIFEIRPFVASRQPPNLRQILSSHNNRPAYGNNGSCECGSKRCELCKLLCPDSSLVGPNGKVFKIKGSFSCLSTNIVYAITCNKCNSNKTYIGETSQSLRQRMNGHKFDIRHQLIQKPVSEHFNNTNHTVNDMRVRVLQQSSFKSKKDRCVAEQKIIHQLDCIKKGLNIDYGFMSYYKDSI